MVQASSTPDLRNGKDDSSVLEEEDEEEEEEGESTLIFMERQGGSPTSSQRGNSSKENDHVTKKEAEVGWEGGLDKGGEQVGWIREVSRWAG